MGNVFWSKEIRERIAAFVSKEQLRADCRLYATNLQPNMKIIMNSTLVAFVGEVQKRDIGGGGGPRSMMVYEVSDLYVPMIDQFFMKNENDFLSREIRSIFEECGIDPKSKIPIEEQEPKPLPDRAELDKIVFDALGLTADERKDVYRAVCRLVWNRISKAKSM